MIRAFFRFIFSAFFWICALIGFLILSIILLITLTGSSFFSSTSKSLPEPSVLSVTLNGPYVEHTATEGLEGLILGKDSSLYNVTRALHHAAKDKKVKGLVLRIDNPMLGMAQLQEIRDALLAFKKSGKPSWCYTDSFGELTSGTATYYLATACNEIWMQPLGTLNLTGLNLELPFAKDTMELLNVKPDLSQWKEYKSYVEIFTREDFSEHAREELQAVADSVLDQFVEGISIERHIPHAEVRELIENGPYLLADIKHKNLINRVAHRQKLKATIQQKLGAKIPFVSLKKYLKTLPSTKPKGEHVALIFGSGAIARSSSNPLAATGITTNKTCNAFQKAMDDPKVKAIVYRINSAGGSPLASESIATIIKEAQEIKGKPVIISMSDYAASGAYWISVASTKIVAHPSTLTGSIGAFGGKFVLSGLLEKVGLKFGQITTSDNANMWSINQPYTPAQWLKINQVMKEIYDGFILRVSQGRHMTPEQVEKVARGRAWTGEQALALNLVDQLGDLQAALTLARQEAGLPHDAGVEIFPKEKTILEVLLEAVEDKEESSDPFYQSSVQGTWFAPLQRVSALLGFLFSSGEGLTLSIPQVQGW